MFTPHEALSCDLVGTPLSFDAVRRFGGDILKALCCLVPMVLAGCRVTVIMAMSLTKKLQDSSCISLKLQSFLHSPDEKANV